jgi:hypothetical protein
MYRDTTNVEPEMYNYTNSNWSHWKITRSLKKNLEVVPGKHSIDSLESSRKNHLSSLLTTYNLSHTVNFATRIQNESSTAIDNIFVDNIRLGSTITLPLINGLSDHDAQLLTINNIYATTKKSP